MIIELRVCQFRLFSDQLSLCNKRKTAILPHIFFFFESNCSRLVWELPDSKVVPGESHFIGATLSATKV